MSHINYPKILQDSLLGAVRVILQHVAENGLQGDHHYYINFQTDHPQARLSHRLLDEYPAEITIVLQHQFWDLEIQDEGFSVRLGFGPRFENIYVPFSALLGFSDPTAEFSLQFQPQIDDTPSLQAVPKPARPAGEITEFHAKKPNGTPSDKTNKKTPLQAAEDNVVSLDNFRATKE